MEEKPTSIFLLACYCFLLATLCLSFAVSDYLVHKDVLSNGSLILWLPIISLIAFVLFFVIVGIGILNLNQIAWKVLFFSLVICVASISSLIFASLLILFVPADIMSSFYQAIHMTSVKLFSLLSFFLSEIIVLYYLTREEIVSCFGEMGEIVKPF